MTMLPLVTDVFVIGGGRLGWLPPSPRGVAAST